MLPRERSIFHIAGDVEAIKDEEKPKSMPELEKKSVGLQLLIEAPSRILPVVTKSTMGHSRDSCTPFLKFCILCHKELKLQMNIFMYR
jgi:zinc-finger of the FCS-type, C2-C2